MRKQISKEAGRLMDTKLVSQAIKDVACDALIIGATCVDKGQEKKAPVFSAFTVEGTLLGAYSFTKYQTQPDNSSKVERLLFVSADARSKTQQEALRRGIMIAEGANFARDLVNEQPAVLTPTELARRAAEKAGQFGLKCTTFDQPQMEELGMVGLLGVAKGSAEPPKFIILSYCGAPNTTSTLALVGKGITFDSGGLSLKTAQGMEEMKGDMGGSAAVIGAMQIIGALKLEINVLGLVPATENMPDGAFSHPGDILRLMNGKTIEIVNTDAEGCLALADALSYAVREGCSPIIDVATLTGERLWPMPLDDDYQELIESHIADIRQTGGRYGGAITAAKILEHFVGEAQWAHLDIAGMEFAESKSSFMEHGASGFGARILAELVLKRAAKTL
jgi:leucyl aminopeptidase